MLNMFPSTTLLDVVNGGFSDSVFPRQGTLRQSDRCADFQHLCGSQFCRKTLTPFFNLIAHIISVRAKEKMVGTHARRVIAMVQYFHVLRKWPMAEFVGYSVSIPTVVSASKASVSGWIPSAFPQPTCFGLFYVIPEFGKWYSKVSHAVHSFIVNGFGKTRILRETVCGSFVL